MRITTRLTSIAFLLAAPGLFAQETTALVVGTVRDSAGKPVEGARVRLTAPALLGGRTIVTGTEGNFRVPLLPPGNYELAVTKDGYSGGKTTFYLNAGANLRQDIVIRSVTTASATVEVVAAAAQVDKTETTTKSSFSMDSLIDITGPTAGYAALLLSPGVSTAGGTQWASVRGGPQMGANYVVNGTSARDNVTGQARLGDAYLTDTVEDTAVIQSPLNAKYGNATSGIISVVTKRGTNEFQGTFRAKLSDQAWAAQNVVPFRNRRGQYSGNTSPMATDQLSRTYEITFSGPIWKDHITFAYGTRLVPSVPNTATALDIVGNGNKYVRLGATNYLANPFNAGQLESATQTNKFHQVQLFFQINQNHQFEYNYTQGNDVNPDLQFNYVTPDANISLVQTSVRQYYTLAYRGIIGSNQLVEVRYGLNRSDTQFPSGPGIPLRLNSGPAGADTRNIWNLGNTYFAGGAPADTQPDARATQSLTANWNIQAEFHGQHSIDAGFEQMQPIWGTVSRNNNYPQQFWGPGQISPNDAAAVTAGVAGKYIVFPWNANIDGQGPLGNAYAGITPTYQYFFGADKADVKNPTQAFYVNDNWTINSNWSLMAGLRFEKMLLKDAKGTRSDSGFLVSPRLELKWDLFGDQSRLVNLSYGQFRGSYNARFYRTFTEGRRNNQATYYWDKPNPANGASEPYAVSYAEFTNPANYGYLASFTTADAFAIDPKFKPDVDNEITLGYRRGFSSGGFWRATIIHREWKDLTNSFPTYANLTIPNPLTPGAPGQTSYLRTLANDPFSKREYNGFEFDFMAPIKPWLSFGGNYTFGRALANSLMGDANSSTQLLAQGPQGWWRDGYRALGYGSDTFEPFGEAPISQNHQVKTYVNYRFGTDKARSSLSLLGRYNSGTKVSLTNNFTVSPSSLLANNPDANIPGSITYYWNGRGSHSGADTWNLDLQYNFDLKLRGKLVFFSQLSIFNVLNHQYPNGVTRDFAGTAAASTFTGGFQSARTNSFRWGMPTGTAAVNGARNMNIDLGFRF